MSRTRSNQSSNNRQQKGQTIWEGLLKPGDSIYQRWAFINEDGFTEGEQFELPLAAEIDGGRAIELPIAETAETLQPSWPNYSAGSLHLDEVPEGELYGRGPIYQTDCKHIWATRSTVNYLIESVRQMGKKTLLFFIKNAALAHVLPIYIDLERAENEYGTNLWDYIVEEILRETGTEAPSLAREARHSDLILLAQEICKKRESNIQFFLWTSCMCC